MEKPKLLLDENIGVITAVRLRKEGYDVVSVLEACPSATDEEVLALAREQERILVTLDRDFGRLVFYYSQRHVGIIFLRLKKESAQSINSVLMKVLKHNADVLKGRFITVNETNVKIR